MKDLYITMSMAKEIHQVCVEASMTGEFENGARACVRQYNKLLEIVRKEIGNDAPDLFLPPVPEDAEFDEVGIAAAFLHAFVRGYIEAADAGEAPKVQKPGRPV
ncbi:MAG: hypothetical protein ACYC41_04350 [Bacillota bacterium]